MSVEGSTRIGDSMKLTIDGRIFSGIADNDPLATLFWSFRNDDFIQISIEQYF
jgi:hypothetical protein